MSWRYGLSIERLPDGTSWYEVREFYYNKRGTRWGHTDKAVSAGGESRQEAIECLEMMLDDVRRHRAVRISTREDTL